MEFLWCAQVKLDIDWSTRDCKLKLVAWNVQLFFEQKPTWQFAFLQKKNLSCDFLINETRRKPIFIGLFIAAARDSPFDVKSGTFFGCEVLMFRRHIKQHDSKSVWLFKTEENWKHSEVLKLDTWRPETIVDALKKAFLCSLWCKHNFLQIGRVTPCRLLAVLNICHSQ